MMTEELARFAVMLEDVQRNMKVMAEAHVDQRERSERNEAKLDGLVTRVDGLEMTVKVSARETRERFDKLETKVDNLETKFDKLETKVDRLETKVDRLETKVDRLETKVDRLETKVDKLETKVDKLEVFASDAQGRLQKVETKVDKLEVFASDAQGRLKRIETHLELRGPASRRRVTGPAPPAHRRKTAKRM
jgi:chromosome segregation ATPase